MKRRTFLKLGAGALAGGVLGGALGGCGGGGHDGGTVHPDPEPAPARSTVAAGPAAVHGPAPPPPAQHLA